MTGRVYQWEGRRPGRRVHISNPETGRVWCKLENMQRKRAFDSEGTAFPPGRMVCKNCTDLEERNEPDFQEPNIKVLLGERIVGIELDLFVDAPEPKKRKKQTRVVRNSNPMLPSLTTSPEIMSRLTISFSAAGSITRPSPGLISCVRRLP